MLHNQLKSSFEGKEQQLFEIHLSSNHHTTTLFQDVLRKNNDIILNCLSKFNDIYSRIEQYQSSAKMNNEQIKKANANNERFYFQFRKTHLSLQNKQNQLFNDVSMMKSLLRKNNLESQHKFHFSSENLKQKGHKTVLSAKQSKQHYFPRSKTNYGIVKNEISIDISPDSNIQCNSNKNSVLVASKQEKGAFFNKLHGNFRKNDRRQNIERQKQGMQQYTIQNGHISDKQCELLIQQTIQQRLNEIALSMEQRIDQIINEKIEVIKQIEIEKLSNFLRKQIDEKTEIMVSKCFLEQSLVNLKNAWEKQQSHLMQLIEAKVSTSIYNTTQKKMEEIEEQIKKMNNILILKTQLRNLNLSSRQYSNRGTPKQSSTDKLYIDAQSSCKRYMVKEESKLQHNFSNSLSRMSLKSGIHKQTYSNVQNLMDFDNETQIITQKMWKQKVYNALGENKTLKRSKHQR